MQMQLCPSIHWNRREGSLSSRDYLNVTFGLVKSIESMLLDLRI
jgi:hypothetical protein